MAQTYENVKVVVVDDGSTDSSWDVIAQYGDRMVAVMKENGGHASAFNAGFAASHGESICVLESDDLCLPDKVSAIVTIVRDSPLSGWCFDILHEFDHRSATRRSRIANVVAGMRNG